MSKRNLPHSVCGVIPPHILTRLAGQTDDPSDQASANARATLEHMRELQALDALAVVGPDLTADFKAGRTSNPST